ncbi:hypothetical protein MKEN_00545300 [Mycena kentingensis (nom. inval.)]|nr:hypothetical protein MKEN_00545300 [Mycena kentingensis (nom. inval.)]
MTATLDNVSSVSLDKTFGSLLVGTYANTGLYVLSLIPTVHFIRRRSHHSDPLLVLITILALFILDTLATAAGNGVVYLTLVSNWGGLEYPVVQSLLLPILIILSGTSACITRVFLGLRYWKITKNRIPSALLLLSILASLAGTIFLSATLFTQKTASGTVEDGKRKLALPTTFFLASFVASDVLVSALSLVSCQRAPSGRFQNFGSFSRVCTTLVKTNIFGALFSIGALIAFVLDKAPSSNLWLAIGISFGRVHTHATLRLLTSRRPQPRQSLPHKVEITSYPFTGGLHNTGHTRDRSGLFGGPVPTLTTDFASSDKDSSNADSYYRPSSSIYSHSEGTATPSASSAGVPVPIIFTNGIGSMTPGSAGARTGGKSYISPPVLVEDPTPENLRKGAELLKQQRAATDGRAR